MASRDEIKAIIVNKSFCDIGPKKFVRECRCEPSFCFRVRQTSGRESSAMQDAANMGRQ
jgi:hypothetical protein